MIFYTHSNLTGQHSFLSASKGSWRNYDIEKLERAFDSYQAAARGTRLHNLAYLLIKEGVKLGEAKTTLNLYVNDVIGYRMTPEQVLRYSDNCFSTADAIGFREASAKRKAILRIFDLKTGEKAASVSQLEIYAAIFCLEYDVNPLDIDIDLRLYQNDAIDAYEGDAAVILNLMETIVTFDQRIDELKAEVLV